MLLSGIFPCIFPFLFQLTFFAILSNAEGPAFQWGFAGNFVSSSLSECQNLNITVNSLNNDGVSFGTPPYYVMAMEVGGIPTTDFVGTDRTALNWVVRHAANSVLMLGMVDSNGSAGGISPQLYTVIPGQDSSCLPPPPSSDFTVKANITTTLTTCQPWGMTMIGGVKPYTVTLAALDSPIITNVTLGPLDDAFTFIDRADPGTQLLAAISDANGDFASGTPLVRTQGTSNVSCVGLVSSSGDAAKIQAAQQAAEKAARAHKRSIIVAVCVTLALLLLIAGVAVCLRIRKNAGQDTLPRKFEEEGKPLPILPPVTSPGRSSVLLTARLLLPDPIPPHNYSCPPNCECGQSNSPESQHYPSKFPSKPSERGHVRIPSSRVRIKSNYGYMRPIRSVGEVRRAATALPVTSGSQHRQLPNRSASANALLRTSVDTVDQPDIIIQHRDGGIVQELPPPYLDRTTANKT